MQVDWLEKNQNLSTEEKRALIEPSHPDLSIVKQLTLLGLGRSSYYYQPVPVSEENLLLMRLLDEQYTKTPFYSARKMTAWLNLQGYPVERKRVRRLLQLIGLEAIYLFKQAANRLVEARPLASGIVILRCQTIK